MTDILQTNDIFYRHCILYEALHKKPVDKAYRNMKEVMPNVDFLDFQYWYFRFLNGNLDLNHERSKDQKTLLLDDMPIEVVDIIVGKVDAASKLSVRKVSKILRSIVDSQKTKCKYVSLSLYRSFSKLCIGNTSITYRCEEITNPKFSELNEYDSSDSDEDALNWRRNRLKSKTIVEENHLEVALNDFSSLLMRPDWKFKKLTIDFGPDQGWRWTDDEEQKLIMALDPLLSKLQIHVENLTVKSFTLYPMITSLSYFKSGVLKTLGFLNDYTHRHLLKKIMETDYWKNAEKLKFKKIPDWFDIQLLFHAPRFTVDDCRIDEERLVKIRDVSEGRGKKKNQCS
ncbi:unnamed protein product [Caenorhabditis brenneri]